MDGRSPITLIKKFTSEIDLYRRITAHVDDALILPLLIYIALRSVPKELVEEIRAQIRTAEC